MKEKIFILFSLIIFFSSFATGKEKQSKTLSNEVKKSLEAKGFKIHGFAPKIMSPMEDSLEQKIEITRISVSLNLGDSNIKPVRMTAQQSINFSNTNPDTILTEDFEGDFPGINWQRSGDPTWGKTDLKGINGSYSIWCAKDSIKGIEPGNGYPDSLQSMMIYGPFDLSDVNYAQLKFWYWLDTEYIKDWFFYMASTDGNNFQGIGVSGETRGWDKELLHLSDVPGLGNTTGCSQVWIAFFFQSDTNTTSDIGAFVDEVMLTKRQINGTPLVGFLSGNLSPVGNPYIAVDHISVAGNDSLIIEHGVEIRFEGGFGFYVNGVLKAQGLESDPIFFTSNKLNPNAGDWIGLILFSSIPCQVEYSIVEYAGNNNFNYPCGIYCGSLGSRIFKSLIHKNAGSGVFVARNVNLVDNTIAENFSDGINVFLYTYAYILRNTVKSNGGNGIGSSQGNFHLINSTIEENEKNGVYIGGRYDLPDNEVRIMKGNLIRKNGENGIKINMIYYAHIINNIISDNDSSGIDYTYLMNWLSFEGYIMNNCLINNQYGIKAHETHRSGIMNNIFYDNSIGIYFDNPSFEPVVLFNDFYDNGSNFSGSVDECLAVLIIRNANGDSCDAYYNTFLDPLFVSKETGNYHLQYVDNGYPQNSPCRDAGPPTAFYNDISDGSINDMGAYGGSNIFTNFPSYDFEDLPSNYTKFIDFTIVNCQDETFTINRVKLSDTTNFSISNIESSSISAYKKSNIIVDFHPQSMGNFICNLIIESPNLFGVNAAIIKFFGNCVGGTAVEGDVSGVWSKSGSPYFVFDDLTVPYDQNLTIEPGVKVIFKEKKLLKVYGKLIAAGTKADSIVFSKYSINQKKGWGPLKFINADSTGRLEYCKIEFGENSVNDQGGGISLYKSDITISNCTIQNNKAKTLGLLGWEGYGGGIWCCESSPKIIDNVIANNSAMWGGGGIFAKRSSPIIIGNKIFNNTTRNGGAIYLIESEGICNNNDISYNKADGDAGGGIYIGGSLTKILGNSIDHNIAGLHGGGIYSYKSYGNIANNIIVGNSCQMVNSGGGGIYCLGSGWRPESLYVNITNNIIANNIAQKKGGGIAVLSHHKYSLTNNVIANNFADLRGGGVYTAEVDQTDILNTILFFNSAQNGSEIFVYHLTDTVHISYSDIEGGQINIHNGTVIYENNIQLNPLFKDTSRFDFHLLQGSPCIDAGNTELKYNDPEDPNNPGYALYPALGTIRNDMGAYGGPHAAGYSINQAPALFSLLTPINGDTLYNERPVFIWNKAVDPNPGDQVVYTLKIDDEKSFSSPLIFSNIPDTTYTFSDSLTNNTNYFWTVVAMDNDSLFTASPDTFNFWVNYTPAIVSDLNRQALPREYGLSQNYPNPFNPITTIKYQLPINSLISIKIYNVLGHLIRTLIEKKQETGYHSIIWDGKDNNKQKVSSGIYLYTLKANNFVKTRKLVLIR